MNPNITVNINVNPVSTETLDFQRSVEELRREINKMKADLERDRVETDALRQEVAELKKRAARLNHTTNIIALALIVHQISFHHCGWQSTLVTKAERRRLAIPGGTASL
ncbi:hypothetical protein ACLKA6_001054 [Drosophila palustris]